LRSIIGARASEIPPKALYALARIGRMGEARSLALLISHPTRKLEAWLCIAEAAIEGGSLQYARTSAQSAFEAACAHQDHGDRTVALGALVRIARRLDERNIENNVLSMLYTDAHISASSNHHWGTRNVRLAAPLLLASGRDAEARQLALLVQDTG